ncbi:PEPxxWA-CTERM sorting domain-containing protein [Sandarakinorhabdus sp.]|uniref:PEPxxWA-CTERM sorting domain-containing protein n=1 Tax=Sandarakinorhabdus sp. TaxID=1916663 RepID=UPI003F72270C
MARVTAHLMISAVLMAAAGIAAPAAAVPIAVGQAFFENFEDYELGPQSFGYCSEPEPDCLGILSGGSIIAQTAQFPASSGTQLYSGTNLLFALPDPYHYSLPGLYANFTSGSNDISLGFYIYDNDLEMEILVANLMVPANQTNLRIGLGTDDHPGHFTRLTMISNATFAIDDLQVGLENVAPGIPEPASWLMMILGFGAVGVRLRRQSRTDRIVQRGPMA